MLGLTIQGKKKFIANINSETQLPQKKIKIKIKTNKQIETQRINKVTNF